MFLNLLKCNLSKVQLYYLGKYIRRNKATFTKVLLQEGGWICRLIEGFDNLDAHSQALGISGLLLWREIPAEMTCRVTKDAFAQTVSQGKIEDQKQYLKQLACRTVQRCIFEDPVWSEDGRWGFDIGVTSDLVEGWLNFWEYYLLGENIEDFPRLAGIVVESSARREADSA
jgi:hypothetical protein